MRAEVVTLTNMCMVYDDKGNVLVQDKIDDKWSGLTFPANGMDDMLRVFLEDDISEFHYIQENGQWKYELK